MSTLKVNNIVAYSGTHVSGAFSGVFSGSFNSDRIDALEAFSSSLDNTFATDLIVNSLSGAFNAFTASLDNTYATDSQLYQLYQATRSIELTTGSLIGITNGLMAFTAALDSTYATDAQLYQLYQATRSIELHSGSMVGITNGLMAYTSSLKAVTIISSSQQITDLGFISNELQNFVFETNDNLSSIQAYTASLKATTLISSSQQITDFGFATTGSNTFYGNQTISGSFNVSGSTIQIGNNTLTGNTVLSGSILVSGSSNFNNSEFRVTGSSFFTGSHEINGNSTFSGSINIASGSSFYRAGNKLFNYGQWGSLETQTGSADTAYAIKLDSKFDGSEGVSVANNGSGFPTRLTVENTGLYNIQFSLQLHTTENEAVDFSVWFAMTGSNIENSNTDFSIEKVAGGGFQVAALNFLTPIVANDYVELYWSKTTANGQLQAKGTQSTPTRPATPSVIVTVTQVA